MKNMKTMKLKLIGQGSLLMHSDKGVNRLDPDVQAHAKLSGKKTKTIEDLEALAKSDWFVGMYYDKKLGPYLPTANILASLTEGAKKAKKGKQVGSGVQVLESKVPLQYDGPRDIAGLEKQFDKFAYTTSVVVGGKRVMRTRPIFSDWSVEVELLVDITAIDPDDLLQAAQVAGMYVGIGDNRPGSPRRPGTFGRFSAEVL